MYIYIHHINSFPNLHFSSPSFPPFNDIVKMENKSHSSHYHHPSSSFHPKTPITQEEYQHGLISMNAMIIIVISIISIFIIFAILLIILLLYRLKPAREKADHLACKESCSINNGGLSTSYSYTSSPGKIHSP